MSQKVFLKYKIPALSTELQGVIRSFFSPGKLSGFEIQPNDPTDMGVKIVAPDGITSRFLHNKGIIVTESSNDSVINFTLNAVVNDYSRRTDAIVIEYIHSADYGQAEYKVVEGSEVGIGADASFPSLTQYQIPIGYVHLTSDTSEITASEIQNLPSKELLPETALGRVLTSTDKSYWVSGGDVSFSFADEEEVEGVMTPTSLMATVEASNLYLNSHYIETSEVTFRLPMDVSFGTYYIVADFFKPESVVAIKPKIKLVVSGLETQSRYLPLYKVVWSSTVDYFDPVADPSSYIELSDIRFERVVLSDVLTEATRNVSHSVLQDKGSDDHPQYVLADGSRAFTAPVAGEDPVEATHLVTKGFMENLISEALAVLPCRVTTTTNIAFDFAPLSVQGIHVEAGDRILVQGQADKKQNGIYSVQTPGTGLNGVWVRAWDALEGEEVDFTGRVYVVMEGDTTYKGSSFIATVGKVTIGSGNIEFKPYIQGLLKINTNSLDFNVDTLSVRLKSGHLALDPNGIHLPSITTPTSEGTPRYNSITVDAQGRVTFGEFVSYLLDQGNCSGIMINAFASRPDASTAGAGTIFIATDDSLEDTIFISNGTSWTARGGSGAINKALFQLMFGSFITESFIVTMNPNAEGGFNSTIPSFTYYHNGEAHEVSSTVILHSDSGERTDVVYVDLTSGTIEIDEDVADGYEPGDSLVLYWAYVPSGATVETIELSYANYTSMPYIDLHQYVAASMAYTSQTMTTVNGIASDMLPRLSELERQVSSLEAMVYTFNPSRNLLLNSTFSKRETSSGVLAETGGPVTVTLATTANLWNDWSLANNTDTDITINLYSLGYDGKNFVNFLKVTVPYVGSGTRTVKLYQRVSDWLSPWGLESLTGSITAYTDTANSTEFRVYHTLNFGSEGSDTVTIPGDTESSVDIQTLATRYSQTSTIPGIEGTIKGDGAYYEVAYQFSFKHTSGSVNLYMALPKLEYGREATPYVFPTKEVELS